MRWARLAVAQLVAHKTPLVLIPIALAVAGVQVASAMSGSLGRATSGFLNVTSSATASAPLGGTISDTATIATFYTTTTPTGTLTFKLFGPNPTPDCAGTPIFTSDVAVTDVGPYSSGPAVPGPSTPGQYYWVVTYNGNFPTVTTACDDPSERTTSVQASPKVVTSATTPVVAGGAANDTATLSGGFRPTGTIVFTLYAPADTNCDLAPVFTSDPVTVTGNGTYTSTPPFTINTPGTYRWVAFYSGDSRNIRFFTRCSDPNEAVSAVAATQIVTIASPSVPAGGGIFDTATLTATVAAGTRTGTLTFKLYGSTDAGCTASPVFTSTKPVTAAVKYQSNTFTTAAAGTYRWTASYGGDSANAPASTTCGDPGESVVVTPITPTIVTKASPVVPIGGVIRDTATLSGGLNPTGAITFSLYGPSAPTCTGSPVATSVQSVSGNGNYTSDPFTTNGAGTFRWVASYGGDTTNTAVTSGCNDTGESVTISPAIPVITTKASPAITVGGTITDTATLSGGVSPTGTISFDVFGPDDTTCSRAAAFNQPVTVAGAGTYTAGPFTAVAAGTYRIVATYKGDTNNLMVATGCSDPAEAVVVSRAITTIVTQASAPVLVGGTIADTANLSGGVVPLGGTITFNFYRPADPTCAGAPVFTSIKAATSAGPNQSSSFPTLVAGTYRSVASYSGDGNHTPVATKCGDPGESVAVSPATPVIVTQASPSVTAGGTISDTATMSLGFNPTGTLTFILYGPGQSTCTGGSLFVSSRAVNGNGTYKSDAFKAFVAGTYRWVASYSGDGANGSILSPCTNLAEAVAVAAPPPPPTTATTAPTGNPGTTGTTAKSFIPTTLGGTAGKNPASGVGGPALRVTPALGPNGFVAIVYGSGFSPGALVTLEWLPGIGTATTTARSDGTFNLGMLVLYHDNDGPRLVHAQGFPASVSAPFLVVLPTAVPPSHGSSAWFFRH